MRFIDKVKGSGIPPLRTMAEMAEEFGVTTGVLHSAFMRHENRPRPMLNRRGDYAGFGGNKRYYNPKEVRAWWKSIPESKNEI